jgi:hypothetical protein
MKTQEKGQSLEIGSSAGFGSVEPTDITQDPEYQKFVESMVPHCHCAERHRPCDGVLAGGLCDENHGSLYADDEGDEWHTPMSL